MKHRRTTMVLLSACLSCACSVAAKPKVGPAVVRHARPLGPAELAKIDGFVGYAQEQLGIPGIAVAIVQGGTVIHAKGYGVRDLNQPQPVDADTLFLIGSNTKALTTLLLATLVDEGRLRWDQPLRELIPSFTTGKATATLRVEQLSCMCAGFAPGGDVPRFRSANIERTRASYRELRSRLVLPPPPVLVAKLPGRYYNEALGALEVTWTPEQTVFDFGEWKTAVAQLIDEDGEVSLWPLTPGFDGVFVLGSRRGRRTLIARHPQYRDYTFVEAAPASDPPN